MRIRTLGVAMATLGAVAFTAASPALAAKQTEPLLQYVVKGDVDPEELAKAGFDMRESHVTGKEGFHIVATPSQAADLDAKGAEVVRLQKGAVARTFQAPNPLAQPTHGYDVFRPWSLEPAPCPTGCRTPLMPLSEWYDQQARNNRDIVRKYVYGKSLLGQDLVAYRLTADDDDDDDDRRRGRGDDDDDEGRDKPVVLYNAVQHAREWIAAETNRRLFKHMLDNKRNRASGIPRLLDSTEVWFVPIVNPDGYDYTFVRADTRMWRKNLRDNDTDGQITVADGVDPNRNWPTKWRFDPEGASDNIASETYRGTGPASEPEVAAYDRLMERIDAKFQIDFHSHGELILYPEGWQVETQATDNPLLEALAGHDENHPAIPGYDPDLAAELYTTNGDITDHALEEFGTQAYTVELTGGFGPPVGGTDGTHPNYVPAGFAFQDSEADVEQVFQENRAFALDLAKSAKDPDDPVSHIGNEAPDFVPNGFPVSHGDPQLVEVNAKKSLGRVKARYRVVETGRSGSVRTKEWQGGLRHGAPGAYYHRMRATLRTGAKPGQTVRVWFTARDERSDSFTYTLASDTGADVLIMAAEDYKGPSSADNSSPYAGPRYLDDYQAALNAAGVSHGSWDTDVTRTAPHPLGIMSHYEAVIWYTGDDLYTRAPGQPGGTGTTKLFDDEVLATREYMNNGGNLLVTGQFALQGSWDQFLYNPLGPTPPKPPCKSNQTTGQNDADDPIGQADNCIAVSNDFQQYWLGAYLPIALNTATGLREVEPFGATQFSLDPAGNQHNLYSFLTTSSLLPDYEEFNNEEFGSDRALTTSSGPAFDPPEGAWFMRTADASNGYQRLTRTFDVPVLDPGETAELAFKFSYDTEAGYDHVFVEARTAGGDDYRTLPDENGNTTDDTGIGCAESSPYWLDTHPHLRRYITRTQDPDGSFHCEPSQPGIWNADTGNSGGFQDWKIDLSQYAGKSVELSIVYQTDPAFLGIGAFADAVRFTAGGEELHTAGFEDESLDGWTTPGAHPGSAGNTGDWSRSGSLGYVDGPGISTGHSLLWGFGLEGVQGANERRDIVAHAMEYFGVN